MSRMVVAAAAEATLAEPCRDEAAAHKELDPLAYPYTSLRFQPEEQIVLACSSMEALQEIKDVSPCNGCSNVVFLKCPPFVLLCVVPCTQCQLKDKHLTSPGKNNRNPEVVAATVVAAVGVCADMRADVVPSEMKRQEDPHFVEIE
nr:hypothetical protein EUGRSUZ_H03577 [Ipomoea batatas]